MITITIRCLHCDNFIEVPARRQPYEDWDVVAYDLPDGWWLSGDRLPTPTFLCPTWEAERALARAQAVLEALKK